MHVSYTHTEMHMHTAPQANRTWMCRYIHEQTHAEEKYTDNVYTNTWLVSTCHTTQAPAASGQGEGQEESPENILEG